MKEKNNILKLFFHSPKPSPQEMALSSSNSKDIIKDYHTNLTSHPLVENPSSFAGSSIRSERDNSIVFQEIKAKPGARQINNFTNNLTEQNRYQQQRQIGAQRKQNFERTTTATKTATQQQQQRNSSQWSSKEKPSRDAVNEISTNNMEKKIFIIEDSMIKKVDGFLLKA